MPVPYTPPQEPPTSVHPPAHHHHHDIGSRVVPSNFTNNNKSDSETSSESSSSSESALVNEQTNINVINNSATYKWGNGIEAPSPVFTVSPYFTQNDHGVTASIIVPIGGSRAKNHKKYTEALLAQAEIDNELKLASGCANIASSGARIKKDSVYFSRLAMCADIEIEEVNTVAVNPTHSQELLVLRQEFDNMRMRNARLEEQNAKLIAQVDQLLAELQSSRFQRTVNGAY